MEAYQLFKNWITRNGIDIISTLIAIGLLYTGRELFIHKFNNPIAIILASTDTILLIASIGVIMLFALEYIFKATFRVQFIKDSLTEVPMKVQYILINFWCVLFFSYLFVLFHH